jgi:5-methylcytosine-specific restriction endonuclease McrA
MNKRARKLRRKAQERGVRAHFIDLDLIFKRDNWTCQLCGEPLDMQAEFPHPLYPTLDHMIPLSWGGDHTFGNVWSAHFGCNIKKGNKVGHVRPLKVNGADSSVVVTARGA